MSEEQPLGATLGIFSAVDDETPTLTYRIEPESPYFTLDSGKILKNNFFHSLITF